MRSGIDSKGAGAEIQAVEIQFEDLILGEAPLQRERTGDFAQLARDRPVRRQKQDFDQLLRDRPDRIFTTSALSMPSGSIPLCS